MSNVGVVECTVTWSGDKVQIVPNSLTMTKGRGTKSSKPGSLGSGSVVQNFFENVESKVGKVKFEMYNTRENEALVDRKLITYIHDIQISKLYQDGKRTSIYYSQMVVANDPEYGMSYEGKFTIELEGSPSI